MYVQNTILSDFSTNNRQFTQRSLSSARLPVALIHVNRHIPKSEATRSTMQVHRIPKQLGRILQRNSGLAS